jgi:hypothetical protein
MAEARVEYAEVVKPVENIILTLSPEEASALYSVLCCVSVKGVGKTTYKVFDALANCEELEMTPLIPRLAEYSTNLIEFDTYS